MIITADRFTQDWQDWHRERETEIAAPHGVLAITGRHELTAEPQRFPDAPGVWSAGPEGVVVALGDGEQVTVDGVVTRGVHRFEVLAERTEVCAEWGDVALEIARRGGADFLRPRHPDNPLRTAFLGTPAYTPDPKWAVTGRFTAFDRPRPTAVGSVVEGLEHVFDAPGRVDFALAGRALSLIAFGEALSGGLTILFTDLTSGITTYPANRALYLDPPEPDGTISLDFNRAVNLPCAYTDFATCPLPPAGNDLPIRVEAGERNPRPGLDVS